MTVLIVDDQVNIISGLISGLDWAALDVTSIHTASNAIQAKKILEKEHIDILLCDIEMPGENGLSLLRWARDRGMDFVCVFLTAHADFLYAKEAIQLGCFDYILQPARYDEIQAAVEKAINRVKTIYADKELKQYGSYAKKNPASLFQNLFIDWVAGNPLSISRLRSILKQLNRDLKPGCDCTVIVGHLLRWRTEPWSTEEWVSRLNTVMTETCAEAESEIISFSIDRMTIGWFLYAPYGSFSQPREPLTSLNRVYSKISLDWPCDFAFYVTPTVPLEMISEQSEKLLSVKRNNVLQKSGIFPVSEHASHPQFSEGVDSSHISRWGDLLYKGNSKILLDEIFQYLNGLCAKGDLDYQFLHTFWRQFQQIVLNVLWQKRLDGESMLPLLSMGENAQSIQELQEAITSVAAQFEQDNLPAGGKEELIIQAEKYVDEHLEQPLTVSDVAEAMYMNADYLSRLFKSKKGISLKEYIVTEKMRTAQILLQTTNLPISIIASKLGYDNFSYFSQVYRKVMGVSPTSEKKK